MLISYSPDDAVRPIHIALLKHIKETQRANKEHRKRLHRCGLPTAAVDAEIRTLKRVVAKIEALQQVNAPPKPMSADRIQRIKDAFLQHALLYCETEEHP